MKKTFGLLVIIFIFSIVSFADVRLPDELKPTPIPKQAKTVDSRLTIRFDKDAKDAKLIIPKNQLKQLRADLEQLDNESDTNASLTDSNGNFSRTQTIIGGMFLSLAFVFGGVWFSRNRKVNKTIVAGTVLFLVISATTLVFANAGPPSALRTISSKLFDKNVFGYWKRADGNIKIQVSAENDGVELIIPDKEEKNDKKVE